MCCLGLPGKHSSAGHMHMYDIWAIHNLSQGTSAIRSLDGVASGFIIDSKHASS